MAIGSKNGKDSKPATKAAKAPEAKASTTWKKGVVRTLITLPIGKIYCDPNQPRKTFNDNDIDELAANIAKVSLVNPIVVRHAELRDNLTDADYVIIDGHRRFMAVARLGWKMVGCVVEMTNATPAELLGRQLSANTFRIDVNAIEEASKLREHRGWS